MLNRANAEPAPIPSRRPSLPAPMLARVGDPLVLPDGRVVQDQKARAARLSADLGHLNPADYRPQKRRSMKDLPSQVGVVTGAAAVLIYTLYGLSDRDIIHVLKITMPELEQLRQHSIYSEFFTVVQQEFINANSDMLQSRIAAYGNVAVERVGDIITSSPDDRVALRASQDFLDRTGAGVKQAAERRADSGKGSQFRVVVTDGDRDPISVSVEVNQNGD